MTHSVLNWIWHLASRDLSALIGVSLVGLSGVVYWLQGPYRISNSLDNIAAAIKGRK